MARYLVVIPFDPVVHETLDSRVFTNIPDSDLAAGVCIRRDADGYTAELEVGAGRPGVAKATAVERVERFLSVLAAWNHRFHIQIGGVRCELIDRKPSATVTVVRPGLVAATAPDTLFLKEHLPAIVEAVAWFGVRLFTDGWLPGRAALCTGADMLAVELEAVLRDPYRQLSRRCGLVGVRRRAER